MHTEPESFAESVARQIALLQERQLQVAKETALELDNLRQHVAEHDEAARIRPLQEEVDRLRALLAEQEAVKQAEQSQQQAHLEQFKKSVLDETLQLNQQLRSFVLDSSQRLEELVTKIDQLDPGEVQATIIPPAIVHTVVHKEVLTPPTKSAVKEQKKVQKKERRERKSFPLGKAAWRVAFTLALVSAGYNGVKHLTGPGPAGQIAGASTDTTIVKATPTPKVENAESMADVPFDKTVWESSIDQDFGISLDYPSNATNRVRVVGGSNLWFLRKNGYLLKISRIDTKETLDQWWSENKNDYSDGYSYAKGSFKGQPAMVGQPTVHSDTSGNQYFTHRGPAIFQVWIKEETPTSDDGQRLQHMVDTLKFLAD